MKPMLAEDIVDFTKVQYPLYGSYKIDGVRALMPGIRLLPRSLKKFGNQHTVNWFDGWSPKLHGFDGELTLGALPNPKGVRLCHLTSSAMASHDGEPDIHWWIFDVLDPLNEDHTFEERHRLLRKRFNALKTAEQRKMRVHLVEQVLIRNPEEALRFHEQALDLHYEGTVFKDPRQTYKYGRSTLKSQHFLRYKPEADAEGRPIRFEPRMKNNNEATINALGGKTRSSHKANKEAQNTLGAMWVKILTGPFKGKEVKIGTGWTADEAQWIWDHEDEVLKATVKFSYFPIGCKDLPRHPVWHGFREKFDMS